MKYLTDLTDGDWVIDLYSDNTIRARKVISHEMKYVGNDTVITGQQDTRQYDVYGKTLAYGDTEPKIDNSIFSYYIYHDIYVISHSLFVEFIYNGPDSIACALKNAKFTINANTPEIKSVLDYVYNDYKLTHNDIERLNNMHLHFGKKSKIKIEV